jgi:hypothetical protein
VAHSSLPQLREDTDEMIRALWEAFHNVHRAAESQAALKFRALTRIAEALASETAFKGAQAQLTAERSKALAALEALAAARSEAASAASLGKERLALATRDLAGVRASLQAAEDAAQAERAAAEAAAAAAAAEGVHLALQLQDAVAEATRVREESEAHAKTAAEATHRAAEVEDSGWQQAEAIAALEQAGAEAAEREAAVRGAAQVLVAQLGDVSGQLAAAQAATAAAAEREQASTEREQARAHEMATLLERVHALEAARALGAARAAAECLRAEVAEAAVVAAVADRDRAKEEASGARGQKRGRRAAVETPPAAVLAAYDAAEANLARAAATFWALVG